MGRLVGRESELRTLRELVWERSHRLISVVGPPGVGKTRLALELASLMIASGEVADGVVFVDLSPLHNADDVLSAVAQACNIWLTGTTPVIQQISIGLHDRDVILILDNFEHVTGAAPDIGSILVGTQRLSVLTTSRVALGIAGEYRYALGALAGGAAVELFIARARAANPVGSLHDQDATAAITTICDELDRLPLAIELAAARTRVLTVGQIRDRLPQRMRLLTGGPHDAPPRQRSMQATIAWSYDTADPRSRMLLRSLATLPGSFDTAVVEAIGEHDSLDTLGALLDQQFVRREGDAFRIPETVRQFAAAERTADEERVAREPPGTDPSSRRCLC